MNDYGSAQFQMLSLIPIAPQSAAAKLGFPRDVSATPAFSKWPDDQISQNKNRPLTPVQLDFAGIAIPRLTTAVHKSEMLAIKPQDLKAGFAGDTFFGFAMGSIGILRSDVFFP
ncbi:hypothetical protein A8B75_06225 [Sphingomonadales bacterium EhC05]|nr:hypothetical protein A8B75_06225 [Sphingomonadales bacterium EhC05]